MHLSHEASLAAVGLFECCQIINYCTILLTLVAQNKGLVPRHVSSHKQKSFVFQDECANDSRSTLPVVAEKTLSRRTNLYAKLSCFTCPLVFLAASSYRLCIPVRDDGLKLSPVPVYNMTRSRSLDTSLLPSMSARDTSETVQIQEHFS